MLAFLATLYITEGSQYIQVQMAQVTLSIMVKSDYYPETVE
jgi:hypothetical protein